MYLTIHFKTLYRMSTRSYHAIKFSTSALFKRTFTDITISRSVLYDNIPLTRAMIDTWFDNAPLGCSLCYPHAIASKADMESKEAMIHVRFLCFD
jgi:hypothetical protein